MTCIGNSGPLPQEVGAAIEKVSAAVCNGLVRGGSGGERSDGGDGGGCCVPCPKRVRGLEGCWFETCWHLRLRSFLKCCCVTTKCMICCGNGLTVTSPSLFSSSHDPLLSTVM